MASAASPVGARRADYPQHLRDRVEGYLTALQLGCGPESSSVLGSEPLAGSELGREPTGASLREAMAYSLLAGGKRIRPVLALATAAARGVDPERVLPLAAAVELIHTYSLIHDDLPAMDDDDLRRGRPTCHRAFGENVAILAGDGLYAEAFCHVLRHQAGEPAHVLAAVRELADATGIDGMVGGQFLDVTERAQAGPEGLRRLHALKTGRLIGASVECVLLLEGASEAATMAYRAFAGELGILFQIVDDILDVTGSEDDLGKPRGSDERHGKRTYVAAFGLDGARALAADSHARASAALRRATPEGAAELEQITDFIFTRTS